MNKSVLKDTMLDLVASLQLVPAARFLPSRNSHGSLSGQLALLFHQVDAGQYSALALVPLLTAVMELKPDVDIWDMVYLSTQSHRDVQPETFRASYSNMRPELTLPEPAFQYLVQCTIKAEVRAAAAEERQKQTQTRMKGAAKLLPGLIESLGTDAATVFWSFFPSDIHDNIELLGGDCLSDQSSREYRSAESNTLQIRELLEQILLHLPMLDLLHSQRVCRHWKDTIDSSPTLQQALYFRPVPVGRNHGEAGSNLQDQHSNIFNPLLQEVFTEWFNSSSYFKPNNRDNREYVAYIPMQRDDPEIFNRPEASWRRMLFQQTVPTAQETLVCFKRSVGPYPYSTISLPSDYTMGQVYDHVSKLTYIPPGDDLQWLFFLQPGSCQKPRFGPRAEILVQKRWIDRQCWCERHFGMEDNIRLSANERQVRKSWCERNPRLTRRKVEWVHRDLFRYTPTFRWCFELSTLFLPRHTVW